MGYTTYEFYANTIFIVRERVSRIKKKVRGTFFSANRPRVTVRYTRERTRVRSIRGRSRKKRKAITIRL